MFLCTLVYITVGVCGYTAFKDRFVSDKQCKCTHQLQHVPLRLQAHRQRTSLNYLHVSLASITSTVAISLIKLTLFVVCMYYTRLLIATLAFL